MGTKLSANSSMRSSSGLVFVVFCFVGLSVGYTSLDYFVHNDDGYYRWNVSDVVTTTNKYVVYNIYLTSTVRGSALPFL